MTAAGQVIPDYGDARRAAALLLHFAADDLAGMDAVIEEAAHVDRALELVAMVLDVVFKVAPDLRSEDTLSRLQNVALMMAGGEQ